MILIFLLHFTQIEYTSISQEGSKQDWKECDYDKLSWNTK